MSEYQCLVINSVMGDADKQHHQDQGGVQCVLEEVLGLGDVGPA